MNRLKNRSHHSTDANGLVLYYVGRGHGSAPGVRDRRRGVRPVRQWRRLGDTPMTAAEIIRQVRSGGGQIAADGAALVLTPPRPLPRPTSPASWRPSRAPPPTLSRPASTTGLPAEPRRLCRRAPESDEAEAGLRRLAAICQRFATVKV